jgi:predicted transcriptional regulator
MPKSTSPAREIPPPLELECLKALWRIGNGTVKDVRELVTQNRNLAYTTVMTVLDRLEKRGSVARKKIGRSFLYTPVVDKDELRRLAVRELIDDFFDGSEEELRRFLDGERPARTDPPPASVPFPADTFDTDLL